MPTRCEEQRRTLIGPLDLLAERTMVPVTLECGPMLLIRNGSEVVVTERVCPHEGADLMLGQCVDGRLHCPRHMAAFDLASGAVSKGWSIRQLFVRPATIEDGKLWVTLEGLAKP